jgi:hypothetical protein
MHSRHASLSSSAAANIEAHAEPTVEEKAARAIALYRDQLGLEIILTSDCRCSVPACHECVRRIGAWADGNAQIDPIKLMAIAERHDVTIKLTHRRVPLNHYVVCVLERHERHGEPLIYDDGIEGQVDG